MKIAIMGFGVVGKACATMLSAKGFHPQPYDPPAGHFKIEPSEADVAFVCVPAPTNFITGRVDDSAVRECLKKLKSGAIAIIRSTLLPGTTDTLQSDFPNLKIAFVPEFLTEATADRDALYPSRVVIGLTEVSADSADAIDAIMGMMNASTSVPLMVMKASSAELAKYLANAFYALKVSFFNEMYDLASAAGVDWSEALESVESDPWTESQHTDVHHGGYRGYGGKCLPKDALALITFARERRCPVFTLEAADRANKELQRRPTRSGK